MKPYQFRKIDSVSELPRRIKFRKIQRGPLRCQAFDGNGIRCERAAAYEVRAYSFPTILVVQMCSWHTSYADQDETKRKEHTEELIATAEEALRC